MIPPTPISGLMHWQHLSGRENMVREIHKRQNIRIIPEHAGVGGTGANRKSSSNKHRGGCNATVLTFMKMCTEEEIQKGELQRWTIEIHMWGFSTYSRASFEVMWLTAGAWCKCCLEIHKYLIMNNDIWCSQVIFRRLMLRFLQRGNRKGSKGKWLINLNRWNTGIISGLTTCQLMLPLLKQIPILRAKSCCLVGSLRSSPLHEVENSR